MIIVWCVKCTNSTNAKCFLWRTRTDSSVIYILSNTQIKVVRNQNSAGDQVSIGFWTVPIIWTPRHPSVYTLPLWILWISVDEITGWWLMPGTSIYSGCKPGKIIHSQTVGRCAWWIRFVLNTCYTYSKGIVIVSTWSYFGCCFWLYIERRASNSEGNLQYWRKVDSRLNVYNCCRLTTADDIDKHRKHSCHIISARTLVTKVRYSLQDWKSVEEK